MTGQPAIRVMSVDDHPLLREGLATLINSQKGMVLVAQAANAQEGIAHFRKHQPDVTLMDLQLPGLNGTDVLIAIRGEFPRARIVILTTSDSDAEIQRAMRAGAAAYLLKSMSKDDLLAVIRSVHAGRRHVPAEVAARLAEHLGEDDLTVRELEVLRLIRDGYRNKQIADQLVQPVGVAAHPDRIIWQVFDPSVAGCSHRGVVECVEHDVGQVDVLGA